MLPVEAKRRDRKRDREGERASAPNAIHYTNPTYNDAFGDLSVRATRAIR